MILHLIHLWLSENSVVVCSHAIILLPPLYTLATVTDNGMTVACYCTTVPVNSTMVAQHCTTISGDGTTKHAQFL